MWTVWNEIKKDCLVKRYGKSEREAKTLALTECKEFENKAIQGWDSLMSIDDQDFRSMFTFWFAFCWKWHDMMHLEMCGLEEMFLAFFTEDVKSSKEFELFSKAYFRYSRKREVGCAVVYALVKVHEEWVRNNSVKLLDPKRYDRLYQFLPLKYIGTGRSNGRDKFNDIVADYTFGRPMLKALGVDVDLHMIRNVYLVLYHDDFAKDYATRMMYNFLDSLGEYNHKQKILDYVQYNDVGRVVYRQIYGE